MPVPFSYHPNRLSHLYSQQSLFRPYFPLVYLSGWLQFHPPPLFTSCSYFLRSLSLPHTSTTPLSMEMFCCLFPPFEAFFQIVPVKKKCPSCANNSISNHQMIKARAQGPHFLPVLDDCTVGLAVFLPSCLVLLC